MLFVGWADAVKVASVQPTGHAALVGQGSTPLRKVEVLASFQMDFLVAVRPCPSANVPVLLCMP